MKYWKYYSGKKCNRASKVNCVLKINNLTFKIHVKGDTKRVYSLCSMGKQLSFQQ